jgi:hypothetical protein
MSTFAMYSSPVASAAPNQKVALDGNSVAYCALQAWRRGLSEEQMTGTQNCTDSRRIQ